MAAGVYGFRPLRGHVVPSRSPSDGWMDLGRWRGGSPFGWAHVALQVDAGFFSALDAGEFLLAVRTEGHDVERPFGRAVRVVVGVLRTRSRIFSLCLSPVAPFPSAFQVFKEIPLERWYLTGRHRSSVPQPEEAFADAFC